MTFLKYLSIKNFKGYGEQQEFSFAIPDCQNEGSGLTIIVGPNNSGKSTIISAINKLKPDSRVEKSERKNPNSETLICCSNQDSTETKISNPGNGSVLQVTGTSIKLENFLIAKSKRMWEHKFSSGNYGIDDHIRSQNDRPTDSTFGLLLNNIFLDYGKKTRITNLLKKVIPNFNDWKVESNEGQDYIEYITGESNIVHHAGHLSDGVINLFKISAYISEETYDKILIIDEPELSLQPYGQKKLFREIISASKTKQIIIMTHSPNFIDLEILKVGGRIFRMNKGLGEDVKKNELQLSTFTALEGVLNRWLRPFIFDIVAKEIFFSNKILFLEGQEDVGLIKKYCRENNINLDFELFGYGTDGAGNIEKFLQISKDLGIKAGALFDGDKESEANLAKEHFQEYTNGIKVLFKNDIRDKFKQKVKIGDIREIDGAYSLIDGNLKDSELLLKDGVFDSNGNMKEENKVQFRALIDELNNYFSSTESS